MENAAPTESVTSASNILDPVTNDVREIIQIINYVILAGVLSLIGVGANIINISVFVKQGFKDSINISLLGLSISDLLNTVAMLVSSFLYNPLIHELRLSFVPLELSYVTVNWPHVCVCRIASFITSFITLERCLCIAMPPKVKNIITQFRTKVIIVSIYISIIAMFCPFFFVNKLEWKYNALTNRSILGLTFAQNREIVDSVTFFIHSVFLSLVLLSSVIICTIVLVVKLHEKTQWREASVAPKSTTTEAVSVKEKRVVMMVILIATIFLVCFSPTTIIIMAMVFNPDFTVGGRYENSLYVIGSVAYILDAINSSVNIIVYMNMSTKYRNTLNEICSWNFKNRSQLEISGKELVLKYVNSTYEPVNT